MKKKTLHVRVQFLFSPKSQYISHVISCALVYAHVQLYNVGLFSLKKKTPKYYIHLAGFACKMQQITI